MELCVECGKRPIQNKKRKLCLTCYQRLRANGKLQTLPGRVPLKPAKTDLNPRTISKQEREGEFEFVRTFFNHNNWIHQPALFHFNGKKYTPDFYDAERNVWIEVSRTRQAYSANREKYQLFRQYYPLLTFEIRKPNGELLDETKPLFPQLNGKPTGELLLEDSRDKNW